MMRALILDKPGHPETLRIAEMAIPEPRKGEVRVRVHAVGLNPVDYKVAASGNPNWTYPFILGLDVAGTIDAVGDGVSNWTVGDRVFYHGNLTKSGGFAEYAITTAHTIATIPQNVSFEEAAALPCAGMTAYQALHRKLHIQSGQTILIHGGAGGVGGFAVQLAALAGLEVISTASSVNFTFVKELGARHVINYHTENVGVRVKELTHGRGVDAVLNTVSGAVATADLDLLAFNGQLAYIAGAPDFAQVKPFTKAISFHEIALGGAHLSGDVIAQKDLAKMAAELGALVSEKKVNPMLSEVISLEEIPHALVRLSERHVCGKIVAKIIESL